MKCNVQRQLRVECGREKGLEGGRRGGCKQTATNVHTHTLSYADLPVSSVACSHVLLPPSDYASVLSQPLDLSPSPSDCSALSGQQLLFSNGRQGNKSFAHSIPPPPSHPYPSLIQQINGHKARAALWDEQGNLRGVRRVGVASPQPQLVCIAPKIIAHINC